MMSHWELPSKNWVKIAKNSIIMKWKKMNWRKQSSTWMTAEKVNSMEMFIFSLKSYGANTHWNDCQKNGWEIENRVRLCVFNEITANTAEWLPIFSTSRHFFVHITFPSLWQIYLFPPHFFTFIHSPPFIHFTLPFWRPMWKTSEHSSENTL